MRHERITPARYNVRMTRYKTARCIVQRHDHFLLAIHSRFFRRAHKKWGLLGGGIEWGEGPEEAVRRELREEIDLHLDTLQQVGVYDYKRAKHVVYHGETDVSRVVFDEFELVDVGWFTRQEIERLDREDRLHAGYELDAVLRAENLDRRAIA